MNFRRHNILIIVLINIIFTLQSCRDNANSTESNNQGTSSANAPIGDKQSLNVVYINIDSLLAGYDLYNEKKTELEKQSKVAEKNLTGKIEAFQKRLYKFQEDVSKIQQDAANIAPVELKKLEEKFGQQQMSLAKEEEALMKQRDNAAMELEEKLVDLQKDLQKKIDDYLEKIAGEKGYDLILMKGAGGSVMYGNATLDITEEMIKSLNEAYKAGKLK